MKLLYITNGINGAGGLERVLSIKASYLAEHYDYEVHILVLNNTHLDPFYEFSPKIQFHSITVGGNPIAYFSSYKKGIQQIANEIQPDIISVCDDGLKGFTLPKIIKTSAKWIYERHVSKLIEQSSQRGKVKSFLTSIKWKLMESLGKSFSKFVVLTEGNKNEWPSLNNLEVISNPLSFYPEESSTLENKTVICVGRFCHQKGQTELIKIWEKIHLKFPDWELHLYGKENLDYLDTRNLKNNISHFPPVKDIESKYLDSSIYVMPSQFEGFGMVLIEAMACGVPCVSFDCDYGPSDIITDSEDGYLVPLNDIDAFVNRLSELMSDETRRKNFGKKAKQSVKTFQVESIVKQWDDLFKTLID